LHARLIFYLDRSRAISSALYYRTLFSFYVHAIRSTFLTPDEFSPTALMLHMERMRSPACLLSNKNLSGDEIANVNFYAVRPEAIPIR